MLSRYDGIGAEDWEELIKHPPTPMPLYRRRLELTDKVASRKRLASEVGPVAAAQQVLRARGVVVRRSQHLLQKSEARAARTPASLYKPRKRSAFTRRRIVDRGS